MTVRELTPQQARVSHAIHTKVDSSEASIPRPGSDAAFFVCDLDTVRATMQTWRAELPHVRPFYAVKCNGDTHVLKALHELGAGFDCASGPEIENVAAIGVPPADIVLSNPCKSPAILDTATTYGVRRTVFDNLDELDTIAEYAPQSELFLRVFASDASAIVPLSDKFGAHPAEVPSLMKRARELGLRVTGVCFHIGSGAKDPRAMYSAIKTARETFDIGAAHGYQMKTLDLGGGYKPESFAALAGGIQQGLADFGFADDGSEIIAEPGTLLVQSAFRLVSRVNSRRTRADPGAEPLSDMLYTSDGVFGSFMNVFLEELHYEPALIMKSRRRTHPAEPARPDTPFCYTVWGPTCDSTDCIVKNFRSAREIMVGDWLVWQEMGAYSSACATSFNGFPSKLETIYV